jgi:hypothetical protein
MSTRRIGIVAGGGCLPELLAQAIKGTEAFVAVAHLKGESQGIRTHVDAALTVPVGALGKTLKFFRAQNIDEVLLAGGVDKTRLFRTARPDLAALKILNNLPDTGDDRLLRAITKVLENEGFAVGAPVDWLPDHRATLGRMSGRTPDAQRTTDLAFGLSVARAIGNLEIGQTVVVRQGCVVAVEAVEGTDAMLQRAGPLAKRGAVVVKAIKPNQDHRLDMPTVGPETLKTMATNGLKWLGLEVGVLILDKPYFLRQAKQLGVTVVGLK